MSRKLGAWDCEYCDTKKIWGNIFNCPGCGSPRSKRVRFYLPADAPEVTPQIAEQLGDGDPNWYCNHCDSGNIDTNTKCWNCGAEKGSSPSHETRRYRQGQSPRSTDEAAAADDDNESWATPDDDDDSYSSLVPEVRYPKPSTRNYEQRRTFPNSFGDSLAFPQWDWRKSAIIGSAILSVVLLLFFGYQFFFNTHEELVTVSDYYWEQSVTVQEYSVVHESSWSTHPANAYNVVEDYRDTGRDEKVHDGWETVEYQDTCYETETYQTTCTRSVYESKTCTGMEDNGDGSLSSYTYECGSYTTESYSCTDTRQVPYSCTKTRQEEIYHYEDIYDYYYEYDINKWVTIATYPTSGNDHNPYFFTDFTLNKPYSGSGTPELGQQQQFQNLGNYSVTFYCVGNTKVGDEGYFTREYSLADWTQFSNEYEYPIELNVFNNILSYPVP